MPQLSDQEYNQGYKIIGTDVVDKGGKVIRSDNSSGAPGSQPSTDGSTPAPGSADNTSDSSMGSIYNYQQAARDALNEAAATRKGAQLSALGPYTQGLPNSDLSGVIGMINQGAGQVADTAFSSFIAAQNKALDLEQQQKNNAFSLMQNIANNDGFGELPPQAIIAFSKASGIDAATLLGYQTAMKSKDPLVRQKALADLNATNQTNGLPVMTMDQAVGGNIPQGSPNSPVATPITGTDGQSYDLSKYNPSNPNYVSTLNETAKNYGPISTAEQAQQVISSNSLPGKSSPITGQMVMSAAQQYGVDPALMMSIMQNEQHFLTDPKGLVAIQSNNPGSIMGGPNGTLTKYATIQDGVNGIAQWLSNHKGSSTAPVPITPNIKSGQNSYGVDLTRVNIDQSQPIQKVYAQKIQQTVDPNHYMFIDIGNETGVAPVAEQTWAAKNGIPILSSPQAAAVMSIEKSKLLLASPAISQGMSILPHQSGGAQSNLFSNPWSSLSLFAQRQENGMEANLNQTQKGNILNNFNNATAGAISELQSLTQGSSGFRFSTALLDNVSKLNPTALNTYEGATAQLNLIQSIYSEFESLNFAGQTPDLSQYVK